MRKDSGFTLIELMTAIAVLAILVSVGVPSLQQFIKTNRRAAAVNLLITDLQKARVTAASRNRAVVTCRTSDGASCLAGAGDWSAGWMVFVDNDNNQAYTDGTDELIGMQDGVNGVTMASTGSLINFQPGFRSGSNGTVAVCVDNDNENGRWVVVDSGRPRLETDVRDGLNCT